MVWIDLKSGLRDRRGHLVELECLRGMAIWLVVLFHAYTIAFWQGDGFRGHEVPWPLSFVTAGRTGVTLFFVLSGFLLSLPFLRGGGLDGVSIRRFYAARALRLVPAYYTAVFAGILYTGELQAGLHALLFQYVAAELFPFSVVWWSLVTEVQFYLLLPIGIALARSRVGRWMLVAIGIVWAMAFWRSVGMTPAELGSWLEPARNSIFGRFPSFAFGIAAALWYARGRKGSGVLEKRLPATVVGAVAIACLGQLLHYATRVGERRVFDDLHHLPMLEGLCWAFFLVVVLVGEPFGKRLLVNPFFAFSGKISYSLFLVHLPVVFFVVHPVASRLGSEHAMGSPELWARFLGSIAISVVLALLGYRAIELPFLRLKEKLPPARIVASAADAGSGSTAA